jgi:hypothetical protein
LSWGYFNIVFTHFPSLVPLLPVMETGRREEGGREMRDEEWVMIM